jgi:hypothetical protein
MAIWKILRPFGKFYGHFGNLALIWYIFLRFGILNNEKSGNPGWMRKCTQLDKGPEEKEQNIENSRVNFYLTLCRICSSTSWSRPTRNEPCATQTTGPTPPTRSASRGPPRPSMSTMPTRYTFQESPLPGPRGPFLTSPLAPRGEFHP